MARIKVADLDSQSFIIEVTDSDASNISGGGRARLLWEAAKRGGRIVKKGAQKVAGGVKDFAKGFAEGFF
jgi:hypothetical protein